MAFNRPDTLCFRYPNTACEVLTSDVTQINDKLAGDEALIDKLYGFLEGEKPLNPLLASFFSKVMGLLITRKSEMVRIIGEQCGIVLGEDSFLHAICLSYVSRSVSGSLSLSLLIFH